MFPHNRLLSALPENNLQRLLPHLETVPLIRKLGLRSSSVYFVEEGIISVVADVDKGHRVEAWLIGSEGMDGVQVVLGAEPSPHARIVRVDGVALRMKVVDLRWYMDALPSFQAVLLHYVNSVCVQASQSGGCNAQHPLQQRLARWLLMVQDRLDRDDLPLTHEAIADMLGVHCTSASERLRELEATGAIRLGRGHVRVLDRPKLEALTCSCYYAIRLATLPLTVQ